jgi:hypothetical protein
MSRIQRINDESLDHLVAVLRYSSLVALLAAVVGFFLAAVAGQSAARPGVRHPGRVRGRGGLPRLVDLR